jgi:hypothetical protein
MILTSHVKPKSIGDSAELPQHNQGLAVGPTEKALRIALDASGMSDRKNNPITADTASKSSQRPVPPPARKRSLQSSSLLNINDSLIQSPTGVLDMSLHDFDSSGVNVML